MDDFKKYMLQHADQMEFDEPGEAVWGNIAKKSKKAKKGSLIIMYMRYAAAACFIILAGAVFFISTKKPAHLVANSAPQPVEVKQLAPAAAQEEKPIQHDEKAGLVEESFERRSTATLSLKNVMPVKRDKNSTNKEEHGNAAILQNIESNFSQLVNVQLNKVRSLPLFAEGPEYYSEFKKQFQQLEEDEKELKKLIRQQGLNEVSLENLINVCQQKLNLLKLLQNEINKTNSRYRQNNNPDNNNQINHINI